jgi:hypothetical protein
MPSRDFQNVIVSLQLFYKTITKWFSKQDSVIHALGMLQEQFKDFRALLYKLKDFRGLEFLFPNSRNLYEPCIIYTLKMP